MKTTKPIDGCCPACGDEIRETRYIFGSDADGNRGVWMYEPEPCSCGWDVGEEVCRCDYCGEGVDHLVDMADGSEYCRDCAVGLSVADAPVEQKEDAA